MAKLLSFLVLVLMVVLLIPTGLVLASQDALPGETMYPVKRTLEQGILMAASLTPWSKAYFQASRANNRFKEMRTLLARNENALLTLNELLTQTDDAASAIDKVSTNDRKHLREQLLKQLGEYSQTLTAYQTKTEGPALSAVSKPKQDVTTSQSTLIPAAPDPISNQSSTQDQSAPAQPTPATSTQPTGISPAELRAAIERFDRLQREQRERAAREQNQTTTPQTTPAASPSSAPVQVSDQQLAADTGAVGSLSLRSAPVSDTANGDGEIAIPGRTSALRTATTCTPGQWNNTQCGKCNSAGDGYNTCKIEDISVQKAINTDVFCGCLVQCQMLGFCALDTSCVSKNYCSASNAGAGGRDPAVTPAPSVSPTPAAATPTATPSITGASCSQGKGTLFWRAGSFTDKTVQNFTVRINKDPAADWTPNSGSGDLAVQTGTPVVDAYNIMHIELDLTAGNYPGWSVQPGFSDGTTGETYNSTSGFTCS